MAGFQVSTEGRPTPFASRGIARSWRS